DLTWKSKPMRSDTKDPRSGDKPNASIIAVRKATSAGDSQCCSAIDAQPAWGAVRRGSLRNRGAGSGGFFGGRVTCRHNTKAAMASANNMLADNILHPPPHLSAPWLSQFRFERRVPTCPLPHCVHGAGHHSAIRRHPRPFFRI